MPVIINGSTGISGTDGSAGTPAVQGADTNTGMFFPAADQIAFAEGGVEAMRLDAAGRVGIGTSSPNYRLQSHNGGTTFNYIQITDANTGSGASDGMLVGTDSAGDAIVWMFENTNLKFATNNTERARFDSFGTFFLGTTVQPSSTQAGIRMGGSGFIEVGRGAGTNQWANMSFANGNGFVGSITTSGSSTSYNTTSDYRLKANVVPLTGAAARVQALKPSRFNFIADPDRTVDGFLAHEAAEVVPEAVTGEKDEVNEDSRPVYQGIDHSKLVPLLTAALQEALTEIAALKARVAALEAAP